MYNYLLDPGVIPDVPGYEAGTPPLRHASVLPLAMYINRAYRVSRLVAVQDVGQIAIFDISYKAILGPSHAQRLIHGWSTFINKVL